MHSFCTVNGESHGLVRSLSIQKGDSGLTVVSLYLDGSADLFDGSLYIKLFEHVEAEDAGIFLVCNVEKLLVEELVNEETGSTVENTDLTLVGDVGADNVLVLAAENSYKLEIGVEDNDTGVLGIKNINIVVFINENVSGLTEVSDVVGRTVDFSFEGVSQRSCGGNTHVIVGISSVGRECKGRCTECHAHNKQQENCCYTFFHHNCIPPYSLMPDFAIVSITLDCEKTKTAIGTSIMITTAAAAAPARA